MNIRVGNGFDAHRFAVGRRLVLGGVDIPCGFGLLGHSDADVLAHAVIDAALGALALGDIGQWFRDDDPAWRGADSLDLLRRVLADSRVAPWRLGNLDTTIIAESPKMAPFIPQMRSNLALAFQVETSRVSVKATTTEKMGFCGRGEGILATATLLLEKN